jgi:hypothetical protein
MLALSLASCYNLTPKAQIITMKDIIQEVIYKNLHHTIPNAPPYIKAITFLVNPVNSPEYMIFAVLYGFLPAWADNRDTKAKDYLMSEIINKGEVIPVNEHGQRIPSVLSTVTKQWQNVGCIFYSSGRTRIDGRFGQIIALCYAKTEDGELAAKLMADKLAGKNIHIFGTLPIATYIFPTRKEMESINSSTKPNNKSKLRKDPIKDFSKDSIEGNHSYCNKKYKWFLIDHVAPSAANERIRNDILAHIDHSVAIIPKTTLSSNDSESNLETSLLLICHKTATIMTRTPAFYTKTIKAKVPEAFPLHDPDKDFKFQGAKKSSSTTKPTTKTTAQTSKPNTWAQDMDKATKNTTNLYGKKCAVEFGRGGRRACGARHSKYKDVVDQFI